MSLYFPGEDLVKSKYCVELINCNAPILLTGIDKGVMVTEEENTRETEVG